jgi:malic enzyme
VFVFPGVGLACLIASPHVVENSVFVVAARRLASLVSPKRLEAGAIFPDQSELREVSAHIAEAAVGELQRLVGGPEMSGAAISDLVREAMWYPDYTDYV